MDARERFFEVRDALGLTDYRIYTDIDGVTKSMLDRLRQGITTDISNKWLVPFLEANPNVNANYILTGNGPMFIEPQMEHKFHVTNEENKALKEKLMQRENQIAILSAEIKEAKERAIMFERRFEELQRMQKESMAAEFYKQEADFYKLSAEKLMHKTMELEIKVRNLELELNARSAI